MCSAMCRMVNNLRATLRAILLISWLALCLPFVFGFWLARLETLRGRIAQLFYAGAGWICGLRVQVHGVLHRERPLMLVSNHASYLDIFVLGRMAPLSFTPKKEVRSWPLIGFLCVLADCVFVERRPSEMQAAAAQMKKRLAKGKLLCLFPEGTTSDGVHLKPFKSGFLQLAEQQMLPVQPASIAYTHIGRTPISAARREEVAWVGEATFFGHFWHFLTLPSVRVEVMLFPAQHISQHQNRKALTQACEQLVGQGVAQLLEAEYAR